MEDPKYHVELKDEEKELIICEGESAHTIGTIGIVGQGRKPITMKEIMEAMDENLFEKFMSNVETIKQSKQDDMKILMTENTKERIVSYTSGISENIEEYLPYILIVNRFRDNDMVLGVPAKQDFFDGDILSQIQLDDKKLLYGQEAEFKTHHCGKYTKKRKYKNKKKRRK